MQLDSALAGSRNTTLKAQHKHAGLAQNNTHTTGSTLALEFSASRSANATAGDTRKRCATTD